ncbi:MAG: ABC-ATPase domain-containing protein [Parabacteroides sp.]|nr:ABC-ATPase domain-containing protein [Parabacteroides sp.]
MPKRYFYTYHFGQRVLPNTIVLIEDETVRIKLEIKLPINATALDGKLLNMNVKFASKQLKKRRKDVISSKSLKILLMKRLPELMESFIESFSEDELILSVALHQNQNYIRHYMAEKGYVAFIGNGAVLPRKGMTEYKNPRGAKAFKSPPSMEIRIMLPDGSCISGMGIKEGITVIRGDAYQGKSTLLSAIYEGIYNHIGGDGREYVLTSISALKIRAESGRYIHNTDISFYLKNISQSICNAKHFTTISASGSTAQVAAISEAVESGCKLMLFDEDYCTNNFMYKEKRIREIFGTSTTTPLMDNAHSFFIQYGISMIIAVGASAQYLDIADRALILRDYQVYEFDDYEKVEDHVERLNIRHHVADWMGLRKAEVVNSISSTGEQKLKLGADLIDIGDIIGKVSVGQMNFIVNILKHLVLYESVDGKPIPATLDDCYENIKRNMGIPTFLVTSDYLEYVRKYDIMQILYRCRYMQFK